VGKSDKRITFLVPVPRSVLKKGNKNQIKSNKN